MREFIPQEKVFINKLVDSKRNHQSKNLWFYHFISDIIPHYHITWNESNINYTQEVTITCECSPDEIQDRYFKFVDLLFFLNELEIHSLISIRHSNTENSHHEIFDYEYFQYNKVGGSYNLVSKVEQLTIEGLVKTGKFSTHKERLDILSLIKKYHTSIIYPLPALEELVKNDFKTFEQIKFEKERRISICGIIVAFIIGIVSPFITTCCSDNITSQDAQDIETAIKELKTETTDSIRALPLDYVNTNIVQQTKKQTQQAQNNSTITRQ